MLKQVSFVPGDFVKVHQKIREGEKSRIQVFEGVVLGMRGRGDNKTFTVRKTVGGVAVERIWPIKSPNIAKIEVKGHLKEKVHRAKLTYLKSPKVRA